MYKASKMRKLNSLPTMAALVHECKIEKSLRDNVSKNLPTWNLGGRQIVSRPIFSDSPYKNRLGANFSALEDQFWPKLSTSSMMGVKIGQNWRKNLFVPQVPNFIRFAWNSFLRSKTMSAMRFRLIFDIKIFWETFRLKGVFGHFLTKSQILESRERKKGWIFPNPVSQP
jgi:hypothetical protein